MHSAKRVAKNTAFLYIKMLITMSVSIYSTRLILSALGVVDFGIFNLIAGVITMLSFLNVAMTVTSQRFMSFYLGSGNVYKSKQVFQTSVVLHLILGFLIVLLLEISAFYLFDGWLNIPHNRIQTAKIIYQFMVISTFFTINAVPYDASINAHENMLFDSLSGIFESILKLGIAVFLSAYTYDRLILYGILTTSLVILLRIIKSVYCTKKYAECVINFKDKIDVPLLKEMFSFAGWGLFGSLGLMARNQGIAVLLNLFYGATINAAYAIANQISSQLISFSYMMLKAVNPQIMKSAGSDDGQRMLRLSMMSSKISFFLIIFFAIPCIFEMNEILTLWLKIVPEHTVIFCRLILIAMITNQLTIGLQSAIQATGKIKLYQMLIGSTLFLNLPIAYFLLKFKFPVYFVILSYVFIEGIACCLRILILKKMAGLSIRVFFNRVIFKEVLPLLSAILTCFIIVHYFQFHFRFLFTGIAMAIVFLISIYFTGLCADEKLKIKEIVKSYKVKIN